MMTVSQTRILLLASSFIVTRGSGGLKDIGADGKYTDEELRALELTTNGLTFWKKRVSPTVEQNEADPKPAVETVPEPVVEVVEPLLPVEQDSAVSTNHCISADQELRRSLSTKNPKPTAAEPISKSNELDKENREACANPPRPSLTSSPMPPTGAFGTPLINDGMPGKVIGMPGRLMQRLSPLPCPPKYHEQLIERNVMKENMETVAEERQFYVFASKNEARYVRTLILNSHEATEDTVRRIQKIATCTRNAVGQVTENLLGPWFRKEQLKTMKDWLERKHFAYEQPVKAGDLLERMYKEFQML